MRTFRYHAILAPQGEIFDTTGQTAARPPSQSAGWVEHQSEMNMTPEQFADRVIERAVKSALAAQGPDRHELDLEHRKKFGEDPHNLATTTEVSNVMDNKTPDGASTIKPPKKPKNFSRPSERGK